MCIERRDLRKKSAVFEFITGKFSILVWLEIGDFILSSAPRGHAATHCPQAMQLFALITLGPVLSIDKTLHGHTFEQIPHLIHSDWFTLIKYSNLIRCEKEII